MRKRRSIYLKTPILGMGSPATSPIELQNEYIESVEVLTSFQVFHNDDQVSPFVFDVHVAAAPNSHPEFVGDSQETVLDVGETEAPFTLFSVRDGGNTYQLVDVEKAKALPQKFILFIVSPSPSVVNNTKPDFWILRLNVVEKD